LLIIADACFTDRTRSKISRESSTASVQYDDKTAKWINRQPVARCWKGNIWKISCKSAVYRKRCSDQVLTKTR
jgi:hypothetical protein